MLLGKYQTEKELGKGSFGTVYKALEPLYGRSVAIKTVEHFDPLATIHEVEILKQVKHDHIIEYVEHFFSKDGKLCIVMEFANRGTLETDENLAKDEYCIWRLIGQIAHGLNYLHTLKPVHVLHRDLKPANILTKDVWNKAKGKNGVHMKIGDFGIAKLLNRSAQGHYYAGTLTGTPFYMAPEVLHNFDKYSFPSDIWSFGAVIYFRVSREHLFTSLDQVMKWTKTNPLLPGSYSPELNELVSRMLDPNPKLRPTAQEVFNEAIKDNRLRPEL